MFQNEATPAQIALTWLLAQKSWIVPIPGTTKIHRLQENPGGAETDLSVQDINEINRAFPAISVQEERYPVHLQKTIDK